VAVFVCQHCRAEYEERVEFCHSCGSFGLTLPAFRRPADQVFTLAGEGQVLTADVLARRAESGTTAAGVQWGGLNIIYGGPGQGKSCWALKVLDALPRPGLFLALEEGLGATLSGKLRFLEIRGADLLFACPGTIGEIAALVEKYDPRAVVVDSVTVSTLAPRDLLSVARAGERVVIAVMQITKEGLAAGSMSWLHLADVIAHVEGMVWSLEKSRFQGQAAGKVLNAA
jgi:predicted ATP-dependent serine protease